MWFRRQDEPVTAPSRPEQGWRSAPTMQRVVTALEPIAPREPFVASLDTHHDPTFLSPLAHVVDPDGPSGRIAGLITPSEPARAEPARVELPTAVAESRTGVRRWAPRSFMPVISRAVMGGEPIGEPAQSAAVAEESGASVELPVVPMVGSGSAPAPAVEVTGSGVTDARPTAGRELPPVQRVGTSSPAEPPTRRLAALPDPPEPRVVLTAAPAVLPPPRSVPVVARAHDDAADTAVSEQPSPVPDEDLAPTLGKVSSTPGEDPVADEPAPVSEAEVRVVEAPLPVAPTAGGEPSVQTVRAPEVPEPIASRPETALPPPVQRTLTPQSASEVNGSAAISADLPAARTVHEVAQVPTVGTDPLGAAVPVPAAAAVPAVVDPPVAPVQRSTDEPASAPVRRLGLGEPIARVPDALPAVVGLQQWNAARTLPGVQRAVSEVPGSAPLLGAAAPPAAPSASPEPAGAQPSSPSWTNPGWSDPGWSDPGWSAPGWSEPGRSDPSRPAAEPGGSPAAAAPLASVPTLHAAVQRTAASGPAERRAGLGAPLNSAPGSTPLAWAMPHGLADAGAAAVAAGVAQRLPDGSVQFAPPRPSVPDLPQVAGAAPAFATAATATMPPRFAPLPVVSRSISVPPSPTQEPAVQRADTEPAPEPAAVAPPLSEAAVTTVAASTSPAPPAPAAASLPNLDELARRLYDPLAARLRAELRLDRERAGLVTDFPR